MKPIHLAFFMISFLFFSCRTKENKRDVLTLLKMDVSALAHDSMMGRETGTVGEALAAAYIANRMQDLELKPMGTESFFQTFSRKTTKNPHSKIPEGTPVIGKNVIGYLDNGMKNTIVIGAHYDHLGMGAEGSLDPKGGIHNGADDNASGIAVLLDMVYDLKEMNHNFLLIAFSGEEKGLWGSNYFVKNPTIDLNNVSMMVNMDMVGMLDSNKRLAVHGVGTSPSFVEIVSRLGEKDFQIKLDSSGIGPSDHTSFYNDSIPVLHFFTGQHEHYHKPTDDIENLNYEGMLEVRDFISTVVAELDKKEKLLFTKTRDKKSKARSFKVTMGVMPDYLYDGKGLKIDGVKEDRPAKVAGITRGDILIEMDGKAINTIHDYMGVISQDLAGKAIKGKILRGEEEIEVEVQF